MVSVVVVSAARAPEHPAPPSWRLAGLPQAVAVELANRFGLLRAPPSCGGSLRRCCTLRARAARCPGRAPVTPHGIAPICLSTACRGRAGAERRLDVASRIERTPPPPVRRGRIRRQEPQMREAGRPVMAPKQVRAASSAGQLGSASVSVPSGRASPRAPPAIRLQLTNRRKAGRSRFCNFGFLLRTRRISSPGQRESSTRARQTPLITAELQSAAQVQPWRKSCFADLRSTDEPVN